MSSFEDIPAAGDALVDQWEAFSEAQEDERDESVNNESADEVEETSGDGKCHVNGKNLSVTWSKSKIDSKEEFYEKLTALLPGGVRVFGGRGLHQDGTPHYRAVLSFVGKVHWRDAASKLTIDGDTNAIRVVKPKPRQSPCGFLKESQDSCAKDNDTFGERISLEGAASEQEKRKWRDIIDEEYRDKAWRLVRELDPRAYVVNHASLQMAMSRKKPAIPAAPWRERPRGQFGKGG